MVGVYTCPCCGSEEIVDYLIGESHNWEHDYEYYEMECRDCNAEWWLDYNDGEWVVRGDEDYEEEECLLTA